MNDLAEKILDKYFPCDTYPVWKNDKVVKHIHEPDCRRCEFEESLIQAMEEYYNEKKIQNNDLDN